MSELKTPDQARSKIMRLPFAARMQFNRMVREGFTGRVLAGWLAEHGVPDVNAENLRKYRASREYRQWLAEEQQVEHGRETAEQAMRLADALGGSANEKLKNILASKLFTILPGMDKPEDIKSVVAAVQSVIEAERLELQRRQADQKDEHLNLEKEKFRWAVASKVLEFAKDERVKEIAGQSDKTQEDKIKAILSYMDAVEAEATGA